jgi:glutathione S-transferase
MLTIHHLARSQSERIVWLCEELQVPYELRRYEREPRTLLAPPAFKALHPLGSAPLIDDGPVRLAESAAIVEYVIATHGDGRLRPVAGDADHASFLFWFQFANSNFQAVITRLIFMNRAGVAADNPVPQAQHARLRFLLEFIDQQLAATPFLASHRLTAADIMIVVSLTTMRLYLPIDLAPHAHIRAYLRRIGERPAYRAAMAACEPDMEPLLT